MTSRGFAVDRMELEGTANNPASGMDPEPLLGQAPFTLREANFDKFVLGAGIPVVVNFWARWCSLSKAMAPHFSAGARRFAGQALFAKVEAEDESLLAQRCQIRSVPTVIVFHNGNEAVRHSGAMSVDQLELWLRHHLDEEKT